MLMVYIGGCLVLRSYLVNLFVLCLSNFNFPDLDWDPVVADLITNDCARSSVDASEENILLQNVEIFRKFLCWIRMKLLTLLFEIIFVDSKNKLRLAALDIEE